VKSRSFAKQNHTKLSGANKPELINCISIWNIISDSTHAVAFYYLYDDVNDDEEIRIW